MSRHKTIATIGVSDAEASHLRLLMRKSVDVLDHRWEWGDESAADLLVVDPRSFAGQMARTRALGAGMRCAVFSDEAIADADLVLRRPLTLANVVAVLNNAANASVERPVIGAYSDDFYTRDVHEGVADAPVTAGVAAASGLDDMLRAQPVELREEGAPRASPAAVEAPDWSRSNTPRDAPPLRVAVEPDPVHKYASRESMLVDMAPRELCAFLGEDLLHVPARFTLPGAPPLALDPKNRIAHASATLGALTAYCHARWRLCDWQPLTTAELAEIRATQPGLAYDQLIWLNALLHSGGALARHLDPGGMYRLRQPFAVDADLAAASRIAPVLLQRSRLHEVAAAAAVPMADVFDFVNACDAIGLIEWQPRPRREFDEPRPSLLQRLRNSFRKT